MAQVEEQVYTKDRPPPIEGQLSAVQAHIEDLEVNSTCNNIYFFDFEIIWPTKDLLR